MAPRGWGKESQLEAQRLLRRRRRRLQGANPLMTANGITPLQAAELQLSGQQQRQPDDPFAFLANSMSPDADWRGVIE